MILDMFFTKDKSTGKYDVMGIDSNSHIRCMRIGCKTKKEATEYIKMLGYKPKEKK